MAQTNAGNQFSLMDMMTAMDRAEAGDVVYCDPPYSHSQTILYGAQSFDLRASFRALLPVQTAGYSLRSASTEPSVPGR